MISEVMKWGELVGFAESVVIDTGAVFRALRDHEEYKVKTEGALITFSEWGYLSGKFLVTLS